MSARRHSQLGVTLEALGQGAFALWASLSTSRPVSNLTPGRRSDLFTANVQGEWCPHFGLPRGGTGDAGGFKWCLSVFHTSPKSDGRRVSKFRTSMFLHGSWRLCSRERGARSTRTLAWPDAARARCSESWTNLTCGHGFGAFSGCADYPGPAAAVVTEPPALTRHVSRASSNTRAWSGKHSVFVLLRRIIEVFGHWFVDCVHSFSSRDLSSLRFPIFCPLI